MKIDLLSNENLLLINPRLSPEMQKSYNLLAAQCFEQENLKSHIAILTSGSTAEDEQGPKMVFLSKQAILNSAEAVNSHLEVSKSDRWLNILPCFHVGGLGVIARGLLSSSEVISMNELNWNAIEFAQAVEKEQISLTSMVPTQVYDLVKENIQSPSSLRAVIVGGGVLSEELYLSARKLGWPLLPSYGMTETCSQIATASLKTLLEFKFPEPTILKHAKIKISEDGRLQVFCSSLLTFYAQKIQEEIKIWSAVDSDGWFSTEDIAEKTDTSFRILGRGTDYIKVGGEAVNMNRQRKIFERHLLSICPDAMNDLALGNVFDVRLGNQIALFQTEMVRDEIVLKVIDAYNFQALPFERIKIKYKVSKIPKTELGKVLWGQIQAMNGEKV